MDIKITYRWKKSGLSMRVTKEGDIRVSAPYGIPRWKVEKFILDNKSWIESSVRSMAATTENRNKFFERLALRDPVEYQVARRRLDAIISGYVNKYSQKMNVHPVRISYNRAKTRWGSCNPRTGRVNFSLYLLLLPEWCIEHVVVHELAHLIVPDHSAGFYRLMDKYFPRWREAKAETRSQMRLGDES